GFGADFARHGEPPRSGRGRAISPYLVRCRPRLQSSLTAFGRPDRLDIMDYRDIITIEPGKRSGKPCIRGLRMTVTDVLEYLAGGMTEEKILDEFPDLTHEDIRACLAFAADR